jgi:SulP family sulfate permease
MSADLDGELKGHGLASLAAAPFGGFLTAMQIGTSKLLEQTGSTGRIGGVVSGLVLGLVALLNLDVQAWVPTVLIGGLVLFLGYTFLVEALARPLAQRAWHDVVLALIIAACCVQYGFLFGILIGIIAACVMFAFNYARIGVVRRHATRAQFSSHVDRSEAETRYLREAGGAVQIYWLSGFIFFGSAERLFERIRVDLEAAGNVKHSFVVLDFHGVPGADSSAVLSLMKLRNYCDKRGIAVVCSSLSAHNAAGLERRGLFGGKSRHRLFPTLDAALSFCEEDLLFRGQLEGAAGEPSFADWLARQLGGAPDSADAFSYLELSEIDGTRQLYHQGEPANSIELVASGRLHVHVAGQRGQELRIRQFTTHTVVGEMGFFRQGVRSASISTDGPATLYTLKREAFERMRQERPGLALAFDDFIIRTLADRLEFANRTVDALSR